MTHASIRPLTLACGMIALSASAWANAACTLPAGATGQHDARIDAVEHGLVPAVVSDRREAVDLASRMQALRVPGVSVAVIEGGHLAWAKGWGYADIARCTPVTENTVFQAASITKTVTALTALRLVQQGKLSLDADVAPHVHVSHALDPTTSGSGPISVRQLLDHTAGLGVHGFSGYEAGAALPTLTQVMDGVAPANSPPVRRERMPGAGFAYSGGGYEVLQAVLEDVGDRPFTALADREVLAPLGMTHSAIGATLPGSAAGNVALAHRAGAVIPGGYHRYPELAAASLWTTPTDLARLLIDVRRSVRGERGLLDTALARAMTTAQVDAPEMGGAWGLGVVLRGDGATRRFGHEGLNEGYESTMTLYLDSGNGVVVLTNGVGGHRLADEIVRAVARSAGWPSLKGRVVQEAAVTPTELARYAGFYRGGALDVWIEPAANGLQARVANAEPEAMIPLTPTRFITADSGVVAEFEDAVGGSASRLRIVEGGPPITLTRTVPTLPALDSAALFLRGSMNAWSTDAPLRRDGARWVADVDLAAGHYEFKLASADWATLDLGAADARVVSADGGEGTLVLRGRNIAIEVSEAGRYRFAVEPGDSTTARLTVAHLSR